ncbi:MAG: COX15/CtaA family protein [Deltaproteobacteria bacterium]|nr:COX15/CtaA family protein [Deltaproteobacteria bacterium]
MTSEGQSHPAVAAWLWIVVALIAGMVVVGGITRLTGSGLSITEWRPITGALPPLGDADWRELFEKYQSSPQYQQENAHYDLAAFRAIFWWEWGHRLLGRVIGFAVLGPFLLFWRRKLIAPWLARRVLLLLALGAFQGALGWLMVKSGLVHVPRVSHYRLAAHLVTALITLSITAWTALEAQHGRSSPERSSRRRSSPERSSPERSTRERPPLAYRLVLSVGALLFVQIVWGAFVAGLRAGFVFPTFPKMGADWIPPRALFPEPLWQAALDNAVLVQFIHRWLGATVVVLALFAAVKLARSPGGRSLAAALAGAVGLQFTLGVLAVLNMSQAPVFYGSVHQAGAVVLLTITVITAFHARRLPAASKALAPALASDPSRA